MLTEQILEISNASENDWEQILRMVESSKLDNHAMSYAQFKVCKAGGEFVAIGRIRQHAECLELCTLWVSESFRKQGIGKSLVDELTTGKDQPVYLVTEIGPYFSKLGFEPSDVEFPSLKSKLLMCVEQLCCSHPEIMVKDNFE